MGSNSRAIAQAAADYASGGLIGMRNRIINGSGLFGQRGIVALSGANAAYGADRWLAAVSGGSGVTANTYKSSFGGSSSLSGIWISGSFTSGVPYWAQRIEWQNTYDLNSKMVTVSGLMYQDTGSTQNFVVRLTKANSADNFGAVTTIGVSSSIAIPSGVVTPFAAQFSLGSSDASNGIAVEIYGASPITVSGKNFAISDVVLEKGAISDPRFDWRHIGTEQALCQRYYQQLGGGVTTAGNFLITLGLYVPMRSSPTVVTTLTSGSGASFAVWTTSQNGFTQLVQVGNNSTNSSAVVTLSSEL